MKSSFERTIDKVWRLALVVSFSGAMAACGSDVEGTYVDTDGNVQLELRFGGQATLTFMGQGNPCTYSVNEKQLTLSCQDLQRPIEITIHEDGSLTGDPKGGFPALHKTK